MAYLHSIPLTKANFAGTLLHHEVYNNADIHLGQIDFHVNALVNKCLYNVIKYVDACNIYRGLEGKTD